MVLTLHYINVLCTLLTKIEYQQAYTYCIMMPTFFLRPFGMYEEGTRERFQIYIYL